MKQKFKRLLSAILAIVLVITGLQFSGWTTQEAKAASSGTSGQTFYLNAEKTLDGKNWDSEVSAITAYLWYDGNSDGNTASTTMTMNKVSEKDHWYSVTLPSDCWKIKVQRGTYNSTNELRFDGRTGNGVNVIEITGWESAQWSGVFDPADPTGKYLGDKSLNIPTAPFTKENGSYYVSTTFYDYYSDVELKGTNRKDLDVDDFVSDSGGSERKIQARQFNEAISEYFRGNLSGNYKPLYFGEFTDVHQTGGSQQYVNDLYGFDYFYNNAHLYDGSDNRMGAHQGLIDTTLNSDNNATMNGIELPYFNEDFLRGENSKNVAVGKVFNGVQFPFKKNAEDYWEFDSAESEQALRMQYDDTLGTYYLKRSGVEIKGKTAEGMETTGFFPFNDTNESGKTNKLNYAFGVRFDIPFTMTADGQYGVGENKKDIVYNFSGDDDVWVFVDGNLVLDIGGSHSAVDGSINFRTGEVKVSGEIKNFSTGNGYYNQVETSDFIKNLSTNKPHTLTMFYMERGLWESNMKITFNFPRVNTFAVNMEVDTSGVNDIFKPALEGVNLSTFDVRVQNYATRGTDKSGADVTESSKTYNTLNQGAESTVTKEGNPEQFGIQTTTDNKSGRADVLLVKYKAPLVGTADANGHRVIIKPEEGETFDANQVADYLQFDMYNEGQGSTGTPYVYLKDKNGETIQGWAGTVAYDGNNNTLTRNNWVTVKVDLQKLKGNDEFDFSKITEIGIGYWDSGYTYIDDITFHKKVTVDTPQVVFQTPQYDVPTYGSITANELKNATGAIYAQKKQDDTDSQSYVIGSDGTITLSDGDTALFTDQFRIGSYIGLNESVNPDYYTTTWTLAEGNKEYLNGTGAVIKDERTEQSGYAADNDENGNPMSLNNGVTKPEDSFLYRSPSRTDDIITPTNIEATFINKINVGSLSVQKAVEGNLTGSYTFTITFSNIFGQINKTVTQDIEIPAGETYTLEGIPVGTHYVIKETGLDGKEYSVTNVVRSTGNDAGSADVANSQYIGDLSLGADDTRDTITITNAPKPEEVTTVFYVESGTDTTLPLGLNDLKYYDNTAKPESTEEADVYLNQDGEDVKFDVPHDGEPSKSVPNEKYTFTYSGTRESDGKSVKGTATVYTFKANNDIYVFDYGLKSDLADISHGSGLFENDVLFSQKVADTTAAFTGLKRNATDSVAATVTNEQSTITADAAQLALTKLSDPSLGAKLTDIDAKVTFQPTAFMDKVETFYYQASVYASGKTSITSAADGVNLSASVKVMPASVVYYEDNFNAGTSSTDSTVKIVYTGTDSTGNAPTLLQSNGQSEQYGHDEAYSSGAKDSAGSATALTADDYNTTAAFTFTGTGFDIIARTTGNSGAIYCIVEKIEENGKKLITSFGVDTYYANGNLYQIPVIHENSLDYGTYKVTLGIKETTKGEIVYLDGIRIYNPLGTSGDSAYIDNEEGATVTRVSDLILGEGVITEYGIVDEDGVTKIKGQAIKGASAALLDYAYDTEDKESEAFLFPLGYSKVEDINGNVGKAQRSILTYLNAGPTNEMYLDYGSVLAFVVTGTPSDNNTIQIEAKLLKTNEAASTATLKLKYLDKNLEEQTIDEVKSSTAMYYEVPVEDSIKLADNKYLVVILGDSKAQGEMYQYLSFSNLKVKGYDLSNPLKDGSVSNYIDNSNLTESTIFKEIQPFNVEKRDWSEYKYTVTVNSGTFTNHDDAAFHMYYVKANGSKTAITVSAKYEASKSTSSKDVYSLRFKAPNATGQFPVQLYTFINGEESSEYISTIMTVK